MSRKRNLFVVVAIVVFAAALPAAAQAVGPYWYRGGVKVGDINNKQAFKESGKVSYTLKSGVTVGPCTESATGKLWNGANFGQDEVTTHSFTVPCKTSIANCNITAAKATKLPWPSKLVLVGATIEDRIESMEIDFTFEKAVACGAQSGKTDTFTGTSANVYPVGKNCHTYDEGLEELLFEGTVVKVSGEDCIETESGEAITAE